MKKLDKQIREDIAKIAVVDKEKADGIEAFIYGTDTEFDWALSTRIPEEEIKFYPGSIKGPEPEDDPESYGKWYYENQPPSAFKNGEVNGADLGVKYKYVKPKEDLHTVGYGVKNHIYSSPINAFFDSDCLYHQKDEGNLGAYDGRPEFALMDKKNYGQ